MRPAKHRDSSEDALIAQIKDSLMAHEEDYAPGAWERFAEKEKKPKGLVFWIGGLSSAAALILMGIGIYFYTGRENQLPKSGQQARIQVNPALPSAATPFDDERKTVSVKPAPGTKDSRIGRATQTETTTRSSMPPLQLPVTGAKEPEVQRLAALSEANVPIEKTAKINPPATGKTPSEKGTFEDFLNKESQIAATKPAMQARAEKGDKWEMGVMVAPSIGNSKKLNMGYGVSMGYALSDKVSLSSGISYNQLAASKEVSAPTNMSIAGDTRNLSSVEASVTGIDVPLEIRYHFSKSLYANIGVSAFAVLNQKQSNSYIQEKLVERSSAGLSSDKDAISNLVVVEKTTEEAPKSELTEDHYLGFYNFSFGYKQKVSKSKSISVEPFMKVPMKEIAKENLRLIGTGVRLKFDF